MITLLLLFDCNVPLAKCCMPACLPACCMRSAHLFISHFTYSEHPNDSPWKMHNCHWCVRTIEQASEWVPTCASQASAKKFNIFSAKFIFSFLFFIFSFPPCFRIHFICILCIFGCDVHKCNAEIAETVTHVSDEEILFNLPALVHAVDSRTLFTRKTACGWWCNGRIRNECHCTLTDRACTYTDAASRDGQDGVQSIDWARNYSWMNHANHIDGLLWIDQTKKSTNCVDAWCVSRVCRALLTQQLLTTVSLFVCLSKILFMKTTKNRKNRIADNIGLRERKKNKKKKQKSKVVENKKFDDKYTEASERIDRKKNSLKNFVNVHVVAVAVVVCYYWKSKFHCVNQQRTENMNMKKKVHPIFDGDSNHWQSSESNCNWKWNF